MADKTDDTDTVRPPSRGSLFLARLMLVLSVCAAIVGFLIGPSIGYYGHTGPLFTGVIAGAVVGGILFVCSLVKSIAEIVRREPDDDLSDTYRALLYLGAVALLVVVVVVPTLLS